MGNDGAAESADTKTVARLLKSFFGRLGLQELHLVGHDVGAWVATTFALLYEEQLLSLTVLDAGIPGLIPAEVFSPGNAQKIWQFYFHAIDELPEFLIEGKEKEYLQWYFTRKSAVPEAITEQDVAFYTAAYSGRERLRNGFAYYRAFNESAQFNRTIARKLRIPILAIGGDKAQGLNVGKAMQVISEPDVKAVSIAHCGHYIPEEQPEALFEVLLSFLNG